MSETFKFPTAEEITRDWGERCSDFDQDCGCCQMWGTFDHIAAIEAENDRLRKALKGVAGYSTMRSGDWRDEFPELYEAADRSSRSEIVSIFARHAAAALETKS